MSNLSPVVQNLKKIQTGLEWLFHTEPSAYRNQYLILKLTSNELERLQKSAPRAQNSMIYYLSFSSMSLNENERAFVSFDDVSKTESEIKAISRGFFDRDRKMILSKKKVVFRLKHICPHVS